MDNFKIIYKILRALEQAMDLEEFDPDLISAENLGISENRRRTILEFENSVNLPRAKQKAGGIFIAFFRRR